MVGTENIYRVISKTASGSACSQNNGKPPPKAFQAMANQKKVGFGDGSLTETEAKRVNRGATGRTKMIFKVTV